jgi:Mrp family chromosome partitioning ATPase
MHALAHSLAANQKKVLMIDVNFKHPLPEALTQQPSPNSADLNRAIKNNGLEKVFLAKQPSEDLRKPQSVDILGNVGLAKSPAEVLDPVRFQQFLMELGNRYDYIFLECAALNTHSDAHELTQYVDKVLAVFNARSTVTGTDAESLAFLRGLGNRFGGALLTEVDARNMN